MFLPVALLITRAAFAPLQGAQDPAIRIDLNSDGRYLPGDRARVKVRTAEDGYLLVLRTDVNGWVRVLFPVDPGDDARVRAGRDVEVRGRGGREAFQAGAEGAGTILAARSAESFHFDRYARDGHWDYRALDSLRAGQDSDPQGVLLGLAQQMAGDARIEYDVTSYSVAGRGAYRAAGGGYYPYRYGPYPWYGDPYLYDPFYYSAFYYSPLFFGAYCYGCFPRFYYSVGFAYPFRSFRGARPFVPGYRPRGAVMGFRGGARLVPMAPPTRGMGGARIMGGMRGSVGPGGGGRGGGGYRRR